MGEEGQAWEMFEQDNPLNHVYIVKTKDPEDTAAVAEKIEQMDAVQEVVYGQDVVKRLNDPCPCGSGKKYKNCHGK